MCRGVQKSAHPCTPLWRVSTLSSNCTHINVNTPIFFEVSADEPGEFSYEIHAVFTALDNSIADEILLVRGYGMLNEALSLGLNTEAIRDMGGFMLRLTANVQHGQASVRDTAYLDLRLSR